MNPDDPIDADDADDAEIVRHLRDILGARLIAYIAGVQETQTVRAWADGAETPSPDVSQRLRLAFRIAAELAQHEANAVTQAWFLGMNPDLDDAAPARLIRERAPDWEALTLRAAERFISGG